jgi:hypothetical protein
MMKDMMKMITPSCMHHDCLGCGEQRGMQQSHQQQQLVIVLRLVHSFEGI